jgi:hypothetical protein
MAQQLSHREKDEVIKELVYACKDAAVCINAQAKVLKRDPTEFPVFIRLIDAIKKAES